MRKREVAPSRPLIIEDKQYIPSRGWAEMIKKVYEVDPLICPSCGGQMRIIAFIEDHNAIDRIIRHLKLTFAAEHPPPPQAQPQPAMAAEERRNIYKQTRVAKCPSRAVILGGQVLFFAFTHTNAIYTDALD